MQRGRDILEGQDDNHLAKSSRRIADEVEKHIQRHKVTDVSIAQNYVKYTAFTMTRFCASWRSLLEFWSV